MNSRPGKPPPKPIKKKISVARMPQQNRDYYEEPGRDQYGPGGYNEYYDYPEDLPPVRGGPAHQPPRRDARRGPPPQGQRRPNSQPMRPASGEARPPSLPVRRDQRVPPPVSEEERVSSQQTGQQYAVAPVGSAEGSKVSITSLRRGIQKAKQKTLVVVGATEEFVDPEFDQLWKKTTDLEKLTKQTYAELKSYLTLYQNFNKTSKKLSDAIVELTDATCTTRLAALKASEAQESINKYTEDFINDALIRSMEHFGAFLSHFVDFHRRMKERNSLQLEFASHQKKVDSLKNKISNDPTKLPQAQQKLDISRDAYNDINNRLMDDMEHILDNRKEYMDPAIQEFLYSHTRFLCQFGSELGECYGYIPEPNL